MRSLEYLSSSLGNRYFHNEPKSGLIRRKILLCALPITSDFICMVDFCRPNLFFFSFLCFFSFNAFTVYFVRIYERVRISIWSVRCICSCPFRNLCKYRESIEYQVFVFVLLLVEISIVYIDWYLCPYFCHVETFAYAICWVYCCWRISVFVWNLPAVAVLYY